MHLFRWTTYCLILTKFLMKSIIILKNKNICDYSQDLWGKKQETLYVRWTVLVILIPMILSILPDRITKQLHLPLQSNDYNHL